MLKPKYQEVLRRFALGDERVLGCVMCGVYVEEGPLDDKIRALVRLAGLLATEPDAPSMHAMLDACRAAGVERDEIFAMTDAIAPVIGGARAQKASASLRAALDGSGSRGIRERS